MLLFLGNPPFLLLLHSSTVRVLYILNIIYHALLYPPTFSTVPQLVCVTYASESLNKLVSYCNIVLQQAMRNSKKDFLKYLYLTNI